MTSPNENQRPRFYQKKHPIRNFFIALTVIIIIALGVFIYVGYSSSAKPSEPISEKKVTNRTVDETVESNGASSNSESSSDASTSSSKSSSSSSSSDDSKKKDSIQESAQLKGKKISEAIAWAKTHGRYYSWSITSGGNDAVVTSVTDDGSNINFIASAQ